MTFADGLTWFFLIFLILGGIDRCIGNRFGLGEGFEEGFRTSGSLILSMLGIYALSPLLAQWLQPVMVPVFGFFGADPSMLAGVLLANDMGGYELATRLAKDPAVGAYAGAVVAALFGVTLCFTVPFAFSTVRPEDRRPVAKGFLIGIATMPAGALAGGLLAGLPPLTVLCNLIPLLLVAGLLLLGLRFFPSRMISGMVWFGRGLSVLLTAGLLLAVISKQTGYGPEALIGYDEVLLVIGEIVIVLAGAFPFLQVLRKVCGRPLRAIGAKFGLREASVTGLLTSAVNAIPTFSLMRDMDERGKVLNAAFSVSAAFVIGDHLAFTLSHAEEMLLPMLCGKLVGGVCALVLGVLLSRGENRAAS